MDDAQFTFGSISANFDDQFGVQGISVTFDQRRHQLGTDRVRTVDAELGAKQGVLRAAIAVAANLQRINAHHAQGGFDAVAFTVKFQQLTAELGEPVERFQCHDWIFSRVLRHRNRSAESDTDSCHRCRAKEGSHRHQQYLPTYRSAVLAQYRSFNL